MVARIVYAILSAVFFGAGAALAREPILPWAAIGFVLGFVLIASVMLGIEKLALRRRNECDRCTKPKGPVPPTL